MALTHNPRKIGDRYTKMSLYVNDKKVYEEVVAEAPTHDYWEEDEWPLPSCIGIKVKMIVQTLYEVEN